MGVTTGYIISSVGVPDKCPGCGDSPIELIVYYGDDVVCANCKEFIRKFEANE